MATPSAGARNSVAFVLNSEGLHLIGFYKKRTGDKNDGCAIFYKKDRFLLEDCTQVEYHQPFTQSLNRDNIALLAKFRPMQPRCVNTKYRQQNFSARKHTSDDKFYCDSFVVATTHLLFNPKREDVRLAQTALLFTDLDRFAYKTKDDLQYSPPQTREEFFYPCIVTGDFNMNPDSPIYKFISNRQIGYDKLISRLRSPLLPLSLGITDKCQHLNVMLSRCSSFLVRSDEDDRTQNAFNHTKLLKGRTEIVFSHAGLR